MVANARLRRVRAKSEKRHSSIALVSGITVFLVLDILLVGLALTQDDVSDSAHTPGPIPTFGSEPEAAPSPTPALVVEVAESVIPAPRYLVVASPTTAWRGTVGECGSTAARVEATSDGGLSWQDATPPGLRQILGMTTSDTSTVRVLGRTGDTCSLEALASFTGGEFWESYPESIADFAALDPTDRSVVHTVSGVVPSPCSAASQVNGRNNLVAVVCGGEFFESSNSPDAWLRTPVQNILAMAPTEAGYTLAVFGGADCAGVSIQTLPSPIGTEAPTVIGCLVDEVSADGATIAQSGSEVWLWNADRLRKSSDGGGTWN